MTLQTELCLCPDISTVDSQIKDSSNSFRRRHSSEGVDAKFSSTLPKDSAVQLYQMEENDLKIT
jgi:hypothetical protein